jgi:hypothetical protein
MDMLTDFRSSISRFVGIGLVVFGARRAARRLTRAAMRMLRRSRSRLLM